MPIAIIEEGLEEIRNGRMVILVNEDAPDSDGFFCLPAQTTSAESINHILHHGRGVIFLALTEERIRELGILLIPQESGSFGGHFFGVPFSLRLEGIPGVSSEGRARTIPTWSCRDMCNRYKRIVAACWRARGEPRQRSIWRG
jgi:3,4-dihydroxy 2-butanone 4-phosphate synthase/GTP cyclohydrolase II